MVPYERVMMSYLFSNDVWAVDFRGLMNWKKSTTLSEFTLSNMAWIQMKAPVLPIPSLDRRYRVSVTHVTERERVMYGHTCT